MTNCVKCGTNLDENTKFCPICGSAIQQPENISAEMETNATDANDFASKVAQLNNTADNTAEYSADDIEKNKIMAVLAYIIFLIPLLAAKDSKFARFHTNQGFILFLGVIVSSVVAIIPIIGWIIAPIAALIVTVLAIIGIINALGGKAKELPIIGKFKILK